MNQDSQWLLNKWWSIAVTIYDNRNGDVIKDSDPYLIDGQTAAEASGSLHRRLEMIFPKEAWTIHLSSPELIE